MHPTHRCEKLSFHRKQSSCLYLPISLEMLENIKKRVAGIFLEEHGIFRESLGRMRELIYGNHDKIEEELKLSSSYELFFEGAKRNYQSFEQIFFRYLLNNEIS